MQNIPHFRAVPSLSQRCVLAVLCLVLWQCAGAADADEDTTRVDARVVLDGAPLFDDTIYDAAEESAATTSDALQVDERTALEISQQLAYFEEKIATLENELGPYDASLIEALADQGRYLAEIGQHEAAAAVYERALSITRISNGLLSEEQLPVLEDLTAALKAAGAWQKADDREYLTYYLQSQLHAPGTEAHVQALLEFGEWKLIALRGNLLGDSARSTLQDLEYLQQAYSNADEQIALARPAGLNAESAEGTGEEEAVSAEKHFALLDAKARTEHLLADYLIRSIPTSVDRFVQRYISVQVCENVVGPNGQPSRVCQMQRVENPRYREVEMQKQLYESRIRSAMYDMASSVKGMQAIVDANPEMQVVASPAQQSMDEVAALYGGLNQNLRRNTQFW